MGDNMREADWVDLVADSVRTDFAQSGRSLKIKTQLKIPYGYEIRAYREEPEAEAISFATDLSIVEVLPDGSWKPRVVVEAKVGSITTHDAITYSRKAADHKSVFPYLRYGIMLGKRQHYPLPGRLYRHGTQFDFMISFKEHDPSARELEVFKALLLEEVEASKALDNMIYESRKRDREQHTLFHRKLMVRDINASDK
jgi:hypothetical protein